jgi:hypothetical protein
VKTPRTPGMARAAAVSMRDDARMGVRRAQHDRMQRAGQSDILDVPPLPHQEPSHYDDDGYVIQWCARPFRRTRSPASMRSPRMRGATIARSRCRDRLNAYDECHTVASRSSGSSAHHPPMGGSAGRLVGVQSNQFPRAVDIAAPVPRGRHPGDAIGGFHVSGCLAMLPKLPPDIAGRQAISASRSMPAKPRAGSRMFAARLAGQLQADLQLHEDLPGMQRQVPPPFLPIDFVSAQRQ